MLQPRHQAVRDVLDVVGVAPDVVAGEHGDDLVVGLAGVDRLQATDDLASRAAPRRG